MSKLGGFSRENSYAACGQGWLARLLLSRSHQLGDLLSDAVEAGHACNRAARWRHFGVELAQRPVLSHGRLFLLKTRESPFCVDGMADEKRMTVSHRVNAAPANETRILLQRCNHGDRSPYRSSRANQPLECRPPDAGAGPSSADGI